MKKYCVYILSLAGLYGSLAIAYPNNSDPVGCETLINHKWSGAIGLIPMFDDNQPQYSLSITFNLTGLYQEEDDGITTTYHLQGQYSYQVADDNVTADLGGYNYGTCIQRDSDNIITWVNFYLYFDSQHSLPGDLFSSNLANVPIPTTLTIPNGGVVWWVDGIEYYNPKTATLQKN